MYKKVQAINDEYEAVLARAKKLKKQWVRRHEGHEGVQIGQISEVFVNEGPPRGLKVTVKWKGGITTEKVDPETLEEW